MRSETGRDTSTKDMAGERASVCERVYTCVCVSVRACVCLNRRRIGRKTFAVASATK